MKRISTETDKLNTLAKAKVRRLMLCSLTSTQGVTSFTTHKNALHSIPRVESAEIEGIEACVVIQSE